MPPVPERLCILSERGFIMEQYKEEFIGFMIDCGVLQFGDFITKSGRKSPFFINTGCYRTGSDLKKLGEYYAKAIHTFFGGGFDVLFGPAYKGIPLSVATSIALYENFGINVRYCSNRKEVKDHGDTGILLGGPVHDGDRVLMIEDVTTSGKSIRETMPVLKAQGNISVAGLCISVDRMEKGTGNVSAIRELEETYGIRVCPIVTMAEVTEFLYNKPYKGRIVIDDEMMEKIRQYYVRYGVPEQ